MFYKKIFDFYIASSIHVAFAAYAFILLTFTSLNSSYDCDVAYFGFFGTITAYNVIKYFSVYRLKKHQISKKFQFIVFSFIEEEYLKNYPWQVTFNLHAYDEESHLAYHVINLH